MKKVLAAILLSLIPTMAFAVDRYVAPTGTDTGACTTATPATSRCKNVTYASTQMSGSDTLSVAAGTYSDVTADHACPFLGTQDTDIVIENIDCTDCTVTFEGDVTYDGGWLYMCIDSSDGWTFDSDGNKISFTNGGKVMSVTDLNGFTIEGGEDYQFDFDPSMGANNTMMWFQTADNVSITGIDVQGTEACLQKDDAKGFEIVSSDSFLLEKSIIGYTSTYGVVGENSDGVNFKRNTFINNLEHGIQIDNGAANVLIENSVFTADPACEVEKNVCAGGVNDGVSCNDDGDCPGSYCILHIGPRAIDVYEVDGLTVRNNTLDGHGFQLEEPFQSYSGTAQCAAGGDGTGYGTANVCDRANIYVYNNSISHLGPSPEDFIHYTDSADASSTGDLFHDGNSYSGGNGLWSCAPGGLNNAVWGDYQGSDCWTGTANMDPNGNILVPSFTNYTGMDYSPTGPGAPQVNAGVNGTQSGVSKCASVDFNGNPRTDGSCDIGAFEYIVGGEPDPVTFPENAVFDDLNRANEGPPLSASWDDDIYNAGDTGFKVVSNQGVAGQAGSNTTWYTTEFSDLSEIYIDIVTAPANSEGYSLYLRLQDPGTAGVDGYRLDFYKESGDDQWAFYRIDNGSNVQLGSNFVVEFASGDKVGFAASGNSLSAYHYTGGEWTEVASRSDSNYNVDGYAGIGLWMDTGVFDNVGGGEFVISSQSTSTSAVIR